MPRLLLIDDDRLLLVSLSEKLRELGYEVDTAQTGAEALTREVRDYAAVICDFTMPGMSGGELLRRLREEKGSSVPFVFITGTREPEDLLHQAVRHGAEFLPKPVSLPDLIGLLSEQLG